MTVLTRSLIDTLLKEIKVKIPSQKLRGHSIFDILHVLIANHLVVSVLSTRFSILLTRTIKRVRTLLEAMISSKDDPITAH